MNVPQLRFNGFSDEWEETTLGEVCDIKGGGTPSKKIEEFWNGDIAWISSSDITESSIKKINISRFITNDAINNSATKLCPKGSICIVSRVGVGKLAVTSVDLCTSQDFTNIVKFNGDIYFLAYFLLIKMKLEAKRTQGTSIKGITTNEIKSLQLPLPTLPEQEKIADFLSTLDEKIQTEQDILDNLIKQKKGYTQKLFNQELRFDGFTDDWEEVALGDVCDSISSGRTKKISDVGEFPLIGSTGEIGSCLVADYSGEFILVARVGANAGKINYFNGECGISDNTLILDIVKTKINIQYTLNFLVHYNLNKLVFGSGQPLITGKQLKSLSVPLPSLAEQEKIADFLSTFDEKIDNQSNVVDNLLLLKKGLLQQLFC